MQNQAEPTGVHMPDVVVSVRKIVWEGNGKRARLPKSVFYPADMLFCLDDFAPGWNPSDLAAIVLDQMAEEYGWSVVDCSIEFPADLLDAFDIPWAKHLAA